MAQSSIIKIAPYSVLIFSQAEEDAVVCIRVSYTRVAMRVSPRESR